MFTKALLSASVCAAYAAAQADLTFTSNGHFKLKHAAFINPGQFKDSEDFMLVSQFSAFGSGHIYMIPDITDAVVAGDVSSLDPVKLDTPNFQWPNNIEVVPHDVFDERVIVVPDGFLVPGKENGGVYMVRMDDAELTKTTGTVQITAPKKGYFYHMGYWMDLNRDGRKDFITARSNAAAGGGELLWLEHPEGGLDSGDYWTEHVIGNLADVSIEVVEIPDFHDEVVIFSAHFFDEAVRMTRISKRDGSLIASKTIDDTNILSAYNVAMVDLNGDGNRQLLINNHETKDKLTGLFAYEFPRNLMDDEWNRETIASGFHNAFSLTVPNMSPGFAYAIYPNG